MMPVLEEPAVRARMHPISVETYHRLGEIGHLSERTELIRGAVIEQMPRTPLHSSIVGLLGDHFRALALHDYIVREQEPLTFEESEPEPDIAILHGRRPAYFTAHPQTAALVIEVCVTSESLDRVKLGVYAEAGIPECWLVLAEERVVERHTEPGDRLYRHVERATFPAQLASTILPVVVLPSAGLFGP
jgi:Uma2 family endonuclease